VPSSTRIIDPIFEDASAMRGEIEHLHRLAALTNDPAILAKIQELVDILEHRVKRLENGNGAVTF
jgi:hypothetical protein